VAIRLALDGFPWAAVCADLSGQARRLVESMNPQGCDYFPGGEPIERGRVVRLPGLAAALHDWVEQGAELVHGPVGRAIVQAVASRGGVLTLEDMVHARAEWWPCATGSLGERRVWVTPAPTHGPSLLEVAAGLDRSVTADQLYRLVLAAIGRRRAMLADPSGTSMVSAGDAEGNVAVVVHSNSYPRFGSGIVEPTYQLVLANRAGRGFSAHPGHPNFPVAGRRPATTLHAWMVSDAGGLLELAGGTPGGENQMPWNAQALARIAHGWTEPGRLVSAPLWEWRPADDGVRIEHGFDADADAALRGCAPNAVNAPRWGCRSAQQVVRVAAGERPWEGAADPRTVGLALGV
jgi:gamma-glutamyltranspeptidase/glutathione hydrolase